MRFAPVVAPQPWPSTPPSTGGVAGVYVWRDGAWWAWDGSRWVALETDRLGDARWVPGPNDATNAELLAFARGELAATGGEPVARPIGSGVLLVFGESGRAVVRHLSASADVVDALPPPPVAYVLEPHGPGGLESIRRSGDKVAKQIAADFRRRRVIEWARGVIAGAGLPIERGRVDPDLQIAAIFADVKRRTVFLRDPVNTEAVASTESILCLDPDGACLRGGDCDDMLVATGSGALAIGIPVRLIIRIYPGARQGHITLAYDSAARGPSVWKCLDPSTEHGQCSTKPYESEIVIDVDTGATPMFVGIGQPHDVEASTLGQTPATSTAPSQLSPNEAQAWFALLSTTKTQLDRASTRLAANAKAYGAVRSDLVLPPVDATPAPESPGAPGTAPLVAYVNSVSSGSPVWTQAASDAEQKLLATASFLSTAIADALAGRRSVSFNNGDMFVQSLPGDAYGVLLLPNAQGTPVLQYVDVSSNAPQGTVGVLPVILIGAVVAVVSLAAAYAISKYCDYLSQAHHDDALTKISNNQKELVQSGAETPEQATAQTKALTDLATATTSTSSSTSADIASITKWIGIAVVSVAAVFGLLTVARLVQLAAPTGRTAALPMRGVRHRTLRVRRNARWAGARAPRRANRRRARAAASGDDRWPRALDQCEERLRDHQQIVRESNKVIGSSIAAANREIAAANRRAARSADRFNECLDELVLDLDLEAPGFVDSEGLTPADAQASDDPYGGLEIEAESMPDPSLDDSWNQVRALRKSLPRVKNYERKHEWEEDD